jgi:hypothetical protein
MSLVILFSLFYICSFLIEAPHVNYSDALCCSMRSVSCHYFCACVPQTEVEYLAFGWRDSAAVAAAAAAAAAA